MREATQFEKLQAMLLLNESFARLAPDVTEHALRSIRGEFESTSDPFDRRRAICAQIGATEDAEWRRLLMQLRDQFEAEMLAARIGEIEDMFTRSPEDGWTAWVTALAEAVSQFRDRFAAGLCWHRFPFDPSRQDLVKELRRAIECMHQGRWEETYEEIVFVAKEQSLPAPLRARMITLRAQIDLWRFENPSRARALLEEAETIAPTDGWIAASLGDCWLVQKDTARAAACYQRAMELAPKDANGYVGMGDLSRNEQRFDEAEAWYRKAIASAGGEGLGYDRLLSVLGHPENLPTHDADYRVLLRTRIDVDPESEYEAYISASRAYLAAGRVPEAREWCERAVRLEKNWPRAYIEHAELCRTQGNLAEAETYCRKAMEVAPDYPSGYVLLGGICEQQSRWADALRVYESFPRRPLQWVSFARASVGRAHAKLGNYEQAERVLFDALREELHSEKMQSHAQSALEDLAADHYRKRSDEDSARRIYDGLLKLLGDKFTGGYHNLLGIMHYELGDYEAAVAEYREAISAAPGSALYHRNLSSAYESLEEYDDAQRELESAYRIDKDPERFEKSKARLQNTRGNRNYERAAYSEAVENYTRAIALDAAEPVYHANLAEALLRVKSPGQQMAYLDRAIGCYERAQELSSRDYTDEINRLRRRQAVLGIYGEKALDYLHVVAPIVVEVASDLIPLVEGAKPDTLSDELAFSLTNMRTKVTQELGVRVPGIRVRGNETDLPSGTYIVMINEIPLVSGNILLTRRFCTGSEEVLSALAVMSEPASDPVSGERGFWIDRNDWERVESKEVRLWGIVEYLTRHVEAVVRRNVAEFLGHQEIVNLLEGESAEAPAEIRQSPRMVRALTTVCKALVAEEVPICPFPVLCAVFEELYANGVSLREIVERIRSHHTFRQRLPGNDRQHSYLRLDTRFEAEIRHALYQQDGGLILAMEPERCLEALTAVRNEARSASLALVVDDATLRPFVRRLVELEFPDLHVLSRAELRDDAEIGPDALIDLNGKPAAPPADFRSPRRVDGMAVDPGERRGSAAAASSDLLVEAFVSDDFAARKSVADDTPPAEMFAMMQDGLFYELGIILPEVRLRTDPDLKAADFRIRLNGLERPPTPGLRHNQFLVNDTVDRLTLLDVKAGEARNPANGSECAVVEDGQEQAEICKQAGLTVWGRQGYLVLKLSAEIREAAPQFQTDEITQFILDSLAQAFPDLVRAALDRYSPSQISQVLRELLDEEISIRNLRGVLESLLSIDGTTDVDLNRFIVFLGNTDCLCPASPPRSTSDLTAVQLADFVRMALRRYISHKYTRGGNTLLVYLIDPAIEKRIADVGAQRLTEEECERLRTAIDEEVGGLPPTADSPVLLTNFEIRRALRKIIQRKFPRLAVLSYQELSPDLNVQPIARISWNRGEAESITPS